MSEELDDISRCLFNGLLPTSWRRLVPQTEKSLPDWIQHLLRRADQYKKWVGLLVWRSVCLYRTNQLMGLLCCSRIYPSLFIRYSLPFSLDPVKSVDSFGHLKIAFSACYCICISILVCFDIGFRVRISSDSLRVCIDNEFINEPK